MRRALAAGLLGLLAGACAGPQAAAPEAAPAGLPVAASVPLPELVDRLPERLLGFTREPAAPPERPNQRLIRYRDAAQPAAAVLRLVAPERGRVPDGVSLLSRQVLQADRMAGMAALAMLPPGTSAERAADWSLTREGEAAPRLLCTDTRIAHQGRPLLRQQSCSGGVEGVLLIVSLTVSQPDDRMEASRRLMLDLAGSLLERLAGEGPALRDSTPPAPSPAQPGSGPLLRT